MTWNYRVVEKEVCHGEDTDLLYEIYEVYYAEDGSIEGWTESEVSPSGSDLEELQSDIAHFQNALSRPTLRVKTLSSGKEVLEEVSGQNNDTNKARQQGVNLPH